MSRTLSAWEVQRLAYGYIGVSRGYLGDLCRARAAELLVDEGVEIDRSDALGTTREMLLAAVRARPPSVQANIVEAIPARCAGSEGSWSVGADAQRAGDGVSNGKSRGRRSGVLGRRA